MSDYGVERCQNTEIVFYTKVLVTDILVGLERILDNTGVGLERFDCSLTILSCFFPTNSLDKTSKLLFIFVHVHNPFNNSKG